jgi:hypothetical protein
MENIVESVMGWPLNQWDSKPALLVEIPFVQFLA